MSNHLPASFICIHTLLSCILRVAGKSCCLFVPAWTYSCLADPNVQSIMFLPVSVFNRAVQTCGCKLLVSMQEHGNAIPTHFAVQRSASLSQAGMPKVRSNKDIVGRVTQKCSRMLVWERWEKRWNVSRWSLHS